MRTIIIIVENHSHWQHMVRVLFSIAAYASKSCFESTLVHIIRHNRLWAIMLRSIHEFWEGSYG